MAILRPSNPIFLDTPLPFPRSTTVITRICQTALLAVSRWQDVQIDGQVVVTGSFNFTNAAKESNAENPHWKTGHNLAFAGKWNGSNRRLRA